MKKGDLTAKLYDELKKRNLFEEEDKDESDNEGGSTNKDFSNMVSVLLHSQTQVHVFHLQTKSYSEHKALQNYYEGIDGLVDGVIESYQGKYGVIMNYTNFNLMQYQSCEGIQEYFMALNTTVEMLRQDVPDSYLQNQIDNVIELIQSTLYKLKYLK